MPFTTSDLLDDNEDKTREGSLRVLAPMFRSYGGRSAFRGEIVTLKLFEDNSLVREALGEPGSGKVLVVDGGGSLRCALLGDQLAILARQNGWEGIIVYGCIRDSVAIGQIDIGVRALNTHPLKSIKKGAGDRGICVSFGGVSCKPGEWLYADEDGIIVAATALQ